MFYYVAYCTAEPLYELVWFRDHSPGLEMLQYEQGTVEFTESESFHLISAFVVKLEYQVALTV